MQVAAQNLNVKSMHTVTPEPLTATQFRPFGDVIERHRDAKEINYGLTQSCVDLAQLDLHLDEGRPRVSLYHSQPLRPAIVRCMEHHASGSQMFMPLNGQRYLVVVAPAGKFDAAAICVFLAQGNQGVNYHAGVWHHFCLPLTNDAEFLVIDRQGPEEDTEEVQLETSQQFQIEIPDL